MKTDCTIDENGKCFMSEEIKEIAKELVDVSNNVSAIKRALLGDEFTSNAGLIEEVKMLRSRVETLERYRWVIIGFTTAISSGITLFVSIFF